MPDPIKARPDPIVTPEVPPMRDVYVAFRCHLVDSESRWFICEGYGDIRWAKQQVEGSLPLPYRIIHIPGSDALDATAKAVDEMGDILADMHDEPGDESCLFKKGDGSCMACRCFELLEIIDAAKGCG